MERILANTLSLCLLALLAFSLTFFASAAPTYYLLVAGLACVLGALSFSTHPIVLPTRTVVLSTLALLGWAWAGLQTLPLPTALLSAFPSLMHPVWQSAHMLLGPGLSTLSLTPQEGQRFWLFGTAALTTFLISSTQAGQGSDKLLQRGTALILTILSTYGLIIYVLGNKMVLWLPKTAYFNALTSTFINKNTFATAAGVAVLLCLYLAFRHLPSIPSARSATPKQRLLVIYHVCLKKGWPWLTAALVNWMALIFTQSRAGMASTLLALLVWWAIIALKSRGGRSFWLTFGTIAMALMLAVLALTGQKLAGSLQNLPEDTTYRQSLNQTSLAIWQNNPILGNGLASYNNSYRIFSPLSPLTRLRIEQAHNTWLQTFAELGAPAAILLFAAVGWLVYGLARATIRRRTGYMAPATGLGILLLVGAHAWADFSANIPGILMLLAVTLGTIWAQKDKTPETPPQGLVLPLRLSIAAVLLALAGVTAWMYPALLLQNKADAYLANPTLPNLQAARPLLVESVKKYPTATNLNKLARTDFLLATHGNNTLLRLSALNFTNQSLALAPADPYLWHQRAMLQRAIGQDDLAASSTAMSVLTGPAEGRLTYPRLNLIYHLWPHFSVQDRAMLTINIQNIYRVAPKQTVRMMGKNNAEAQAWLHERIGTTAP